MISPLDQLHSKLLKQFPSVERSMDAFNVTPFSGIGSETMSRNLHYTCSCQNFILDLDLRDPIGRLVWHGIIPEWEFDLVFCSYATTGYSGFMRIDFHSTVQELLKVDYTNQQEVEDFAVRSAREVVL